MSYITRKSYDEIKNKLERLVTVKRVEIAEKIRVAAEKGDLSENYEYHNAREQQSLLEGQIRELAGVIESAKIIENADASRVCIGCKVHLETSGKMVKYHIVGPEEADPSLGKISYKSPLGELLLNKAVGEEIRLKTIKGEVFYIIKEIRGEE
ncbi:MAG: transcription elongation factor GreA [Parcubacteria group bacterium]|nr:transcription elongation factor GreA [Parcubacteria group bacterium]